MSRAPLRTSDPATDCKECRVPLIRTVCPHCSEPIAAQQAAAGQTVACPRCGGAVTDPASVLEDGKGLAARLPSIEVAPSDEAPSARRFSREERERRRALRNLLMMVVGVVVLVIAAAVLRRL